MPKLKNEISVLDPISGHYTTTSKSFNIKVKNSEDFYFTFLSYLKPSLKIKSVRDIHVLTKLCMSMEFNTNRVMLPSFKRKEICSELNIQNTHLSNSIHNLKVLGIVAGEGGSYELNPFIVWKGHTDARDSLLKKDGLEIKLKFKVELDEDDEEAVYNPMNGGSKEFDI